MKIISKLWHRKIQAAQQELPKPEEVKQIVTDAAEKVEEVGHEFTEAVKAKYFTRTATSRNNGAVTLIFDSETEKLKCWTRLNPDGSEVICKINDDLAPVIRQSTIENGDTITRTTISRLGNTSEVYVKTFDLSEFPRIVLSESDKVFLKGQKQPISNTNCTKTTSMPVSFKISKEDYKDLFI